MRAAWAVTALAVGCADGGNGTAVGNPGQLDVLVTDVPYGMQLREASFAMAAIELVDCDRDLSILYFDEPFDALDPSPVPFPGGEFCHTVVLPDGEGSLRVAGSIDDVPFERELSLEPFSLRGRYTVDGDTVLVTLSLAAAVRQAESAQEQAGALASSAPEESWVPAVVGGLEVTDGAYEDATPVPGMDVAGCSAVPGVAPSGGLLALGLLGVGLSRRRTAPR